MVGEMTVHLAKKGHDLLPHAFHYGTGDDPAGPVAPIDHHPKAAVDGNVLTQISAVLLYQARIRLDRPLAGGEPPLLHNISYLLHLPPEERALFKGDFKTVVVRGIMASRYHDAALDIEVEK